MLSNLSSGNIENLLGGLAVRKPVFSQHQIEDKKDESKGRGLRGKVVRHLTNTQFSPQTPKK